MKDVLFTTEFIKDFIYNQSFLQPLSFLKDEYHYAFE